ncbi:hypothetical protein VIBNISOn1_120008 [Vibrio nigripulchritudo SOn1]|uniref:AAA ATPase n=1 Tax=Vibrio nigripulchritudo SOn1 TaxID=1238450 RepID=A0AAV2VJK0_9VIBR|nr:hypothetical protein VIBNISOn1_120008 [Vibrio nigripulchritudo SOn1]
MTDESAPLVEDLEPELEASVSEEAVSEEPVLEEPESIELDDADLGEFDEDAALDAMADEPAPLAEDLVSEISDDEENEPESIQLDDSDLGEYDEAAALQDAFSLSEDTPTAPVTEDDLSQFDESATMATLLSEPDEGAIGGFDEPLDSKVVDSAGMDIDAMLETGEDWNGFNLTPEQQASISEDVPDEEKEVWGAAETLEEPKVDEEDWADQPDLSNEGDADQKFMSVDELMAQVEREEAESGDKPDPDAEALELDVGLDEFPDVLGNVEPFDVDSNSEAAGKLDLAKIYVEMNDTDGAIKLLEEAIVYGDDEVRREAKSLIDKLNEN